MTHTLPTAKRRTLAGLACGLAALLAAAPAGAAWHPPVDLSPAGQDAGGAQVRVDARGNAIAIWTANGAAQSAARPAGGAWQAPVAMSTPGQVSRDAQLAVTSHGDAVALWRESGVVHGATRPAGGTWQAPVAVSEAGAPAHSPRVAVDPHGNAVAIWVSDRDVQAATRSVGGSWQPPVVLSAPRTGTYEGDDSPDVAIDAQGDAVAIWVHRSSPDIVHATLQSALRPANGSWQAPDDIHVGGAYTGIPDVAVDPQGTATAVWADKGVYYGGPVYAATRPRSASWQAPVVLASAGSQAKVAVDAHGTATAVWDTGGIGRYPWASGVQSAVRLAGATWQAPVGISQAEGRSVAPQVSVADDGRAVAVWPHHLVTYPFAEQDPNVVHAALRGTDGSWQAPVALSARDRSSGGPDVAIDSSGNAVAVWRSLSGLIGSVQAADYSPALTRLRVSPATFHAARSGPAVRSATAGTGTRVSYTLEAAASVRFSVARVRAGRSVNGRCVKPGRANGRRPVCNRLVAVRGSFTRHATAGTHRFTFSGRLAGRTLRPGSYRLKAIPTAGGRAGTPALARFRVTR